MLNAPDKLKVTVTKTADGQFDYLQVMSADQFSINVVLIAKAIEITDARVNPQPKEAGQPNVTTDWHGTSSVDARDVLARRQNPQSKEVKE